jgi:hypothetical protein
MTSDEPPLPRSQRWLLGRSAKEAVVERTTSHELLEDSKNPWRKWVNHGLMD